MSEGQEGILEQIANMMHVMGMVNDFLESFEVVFDNDWDHTLASLQDTCADIYEVRWSFINNSSPDEGDNWANRKWLLKEYRKLVKAMMEYDLHSRDYEDD